jgi:hypothetical protein
LTRLIICSLKDLTPSSGEFPLFPNLIFLATSSISLSGHAKSDIGVAKFNAFTSLARSVMAENIFFLDVDFNETIFIKSIDNANVRKLFNTNR